MSLIFPICKNCLKLLADIQLEFEEKYILIVESNNDEHEKIKKIEQLFEYFDIKFYCCKIRLITYIKKNNLLLLKE